MSQIGYFNLLKFRQDFVYRARYRDNWPPDCTTPAPDPSIQPRQAVRQAGGWAGGQQRQQQRQPVMHWEAAVAAAQ